MTDTNQQQQRKSRQAPERELPDVIDENAISVIMDDPEHTDVQTPQAVVEEHKRQIAESDRRFQEAEAARQRAETARQQALKQAEDAQKSAYTAQETAITNQIATQENALKQATTAYRAAREGGDIDGEMKALEALTDAKTSLSTLQSQKMYLETAKANRVSQAASTQTTDTDPSVTRQSPQDSYRGPHGFSKASEDYLARHPKFDSDPTYKSVLLGAAQSAVRDGCVADTPAFFQYVDKVIAEVFSTKQTNQNQQQSRQRPASSQAAPPSRDQGQRDQIQQGNQISATAVARAMGVSIDDMKDFARVANMTFENYVREQASIIQETGRGQNTGLFRGEFG